MEPGFVFPSADHDLTDVYLAGEIAGRPVVSAFVHRADVYSAVPDELVSGLEHVRDRDGNEAYFLCSPVRYAGKNKTRKLRRIDGDPRKSYWHSEARKVPLEGSKTGGYVQDFAHAIKGADGLTKRLGWRMKEYGVTTEHGDSDLVVCKVYRTPYRKSATPAEDMPVYSDPAINSKKRKAADGDYSEDSTPSARPRLTDEHPPTEPAESAANELFKMCRPVTDDERIRAAMPNAPDPKKDLDGYMACFEQLVKNTLAEAAQEIDASSRQKIKPAQPEPEICVAAPPPTSTSFCQSMEQEFPFLYPNHNNDAVTKEAALPPAPAAQPEEDVGMIRRCGDDDVVTPWPSFMHMMMH